MVAFLLLTVYLVRVIALNISCGTNEVISTFVGGTVSENLYEYKVSEYNILSEEEFELKYHTEIDDELYDVYSDIYILTVDMAITKKEIVDESIYKFSLSNIYAQTLTYSQGMSYNLFTLINTEKTEFGENTDTIRVTMPYVFVKDVFSEKSWNNFKESTLKISLCNAENTKKEIILHK